MLETLIVIRVNLISGVLLIESHDETGYPYPYPYTSVSGVPDIERYRVRGPHIGHHLHLCELAAEGRVTLEQFKSMVKNGKFICKSCGRVAAEELHLCDPVPL